jgi:hypothetical protein
VKTSGAEKSDEPNLLPNEQKRSFVKSLKTSGAEKLELKHAQRL